MNNTDIRAEVQEAGLKLWEVADALGIKSDSSFSRKLRRELSMDEKKKIRKVIMRLSQEKGKRHAHANHSTTSGSL